MKKIFVIVATIIGVIVLGNVLIVGAQSGRVASIAGMNSAMMDTNATGNYTGTLPYGRWMHGVYTGTVPYGAQMRGQMGQLEQKVLDAVSAKLGMTSTDLVTALRSGQTLTALAQSKNVSLTDLQAAADAARKAALDDLVKQNVITQAQEDLMLAHMQDMRILGFGGFGGFMGGRGHMGGFGFPGRGMMPGFPGGMMHPGQQPQPPVTTPSSQG